MAVFRSVSLAQQVRRSLIAATAIATAATLTLGAPANAAVTSGVVKTNGAGMGLLVHYKQGFQANGFLGELAGQSAVAATGVKVASQRALGRGWHVLNFSAPASETQLQRAIVAMKQQDGVTSVGVNRFFEAASMPTRRTSGSANFLAGLVSPGGLARAFKASTAPLKVTAKDAWSSSAPTTAAITVGWAKPKNTYGYKLAGYRVQTSFDGGTTTQTLPTTYSAKTISTQLQTGLTIGVPLAVRVAAVTTSGKTKKTGTYSAWVGVTPTGLPAAPVFAGGPVSSGAPTVAWSALTMQQAGAMPITYEAVASAPGQADVTCSTTATTCSFIGLVAGYSYTVKLRATNDHGTSAYVAGPLVSDPGYRSEWHLNGTNGIHVENAWKTATGSGVTVAVIDGGITQHPDLDSQLWRNSDQSVYGYDFVSDLSGSADGDGWDSNPADPGGLEQGSAHAWHGTHVSGIIAAAQNGIGVVGVAPGAKLLEVRALGNTGGTSADLVAALHWAAGISVPGVPDNIHPAKVVNLSLGELTYSACDDATAAAMQTLHDAGISVISAAGNDGQPAFYSYPGNCYPTINVGATGFSGDRAYYSNWGLGVDISAPGGDDTVTSGAPTLSQGMIYSTYNSGTNAIGNPNYDVLEGTSMATPVIVGIVALLYSAKPGLTPDQVWTSLKSSATPWASGTKCAKAAVDQLKRPNDVTIMSCGAGIANAGAAVNYAVSHF